MVKMARGYYLHFRVKDRLLQALVHCTCSSCDWLSLGFPKSPGVMIGTTAVIKLPSGEIKLYTLDGKSPSFVRPLPQAKQQLLSEAATKVIDGHQAMKFEMDLDEGIALDAVHLLFAGGKGDTLNYHGGTRGSFTLNLLGHHYTYLLDPPPPPPGVSPEQQPGVQASTCFLEGGVEDINDDLPCSATLEEGVEMDYALGETHIRAEVRCNGCDTSGWLALGFMPSQSGRVQGTAMVGHFPKLESSTGAAWDVVNMEYQGSGTLKKTGGKTKKYDAHAVSAKPNAVELSVDAPSSKNWFRICLTSNPSDSVQCTGGAIIGLHPTRKIYTGCHHSNKKKSFKYIKQTFKPGDVLSLKFDAAEKQVLFKKGEDTVGICQTNAAGLHAKVWIHRKGNQLVGVKLVTAELVGAMIRKHRVQAVSETEVLQLTEMEAASQTLTGTSVETLDQKFTMAFAAQLGEEGVPVDLTQTQVLVARGTFSDAATLSAAPAKWSMTPLRLTGISHPPPVQTPASPAPPPPACDSASLAGIAGYPCTADLGGFMQLFYKLDDTQFKARVHCPTCKGWIGLGFAGSRPGAMIGGKAVIGNFDDTGSVAAFRLNGKNVPSVTKTIAESVQLKDTKLESGEGVTLSFTADLGSGGVPADLKENIAHLIFSAGLKVGGYLYRLCSSA